MNNSPQHPRICPYSLRFRPLKGAVAMFLESSWETHHCISMTHVILCLKNTFVVFSFIPREYWVKSWGCVVTTTSNPSRLSVCIHYAPAGRHSSESGLHCSCSGYCAVQPKLQCKLVDQTPDGLTNCPCWWFDIFLLK